MIPTDTVDKLEATWRALAAVGAELSEAEWKLPTDCPGWTVQDNLSHVIGTERVLQGLSPAPVLADYPDHVKNPIGRHNEDEIELRRPQPGAEVLAEWNELLELRLSTLRNGDDEYYARPMVTPTGPGTMADFLHIRVMDCYAHEQDIRRAVARPGDLDSPAAAHAVDRLLRTVPIVVGKRAGTPEGKTFVLHLTGPVARSVALTVVDGRATVVPTIPDDVAVTVTMDSETFLVLALGRRTAEQTSAGWSITGDTEIGTKFVSQLGMMI